MAKKLKSKKIKLKSTESHYFYVTKRSIADPTEKLCLKKYDPVLRKHVDFKEEKKLK